VITLEIKFVSHGTFKCVHMMAGVVVAGIAGTKTSSVLPKEGGVVT